MLELHTVPFGLGSVHGKILEMFWAQWDSKGLYRITICTKKKKSVFFAHSAFSLPKAAAASAGASKALWAKTKKSLFWSVCSRGFWLSQKTKIKVFYKENILNYGFPSGTFHSKNIYYNIDFYLQANTALSYKIST